MSLKPTSPAFKPASAAAKAAAGKGLQRASGLAARASGAPAGSLKANATTGSKRAGEKEFDFSKKDFAFLSELVYKKTGIVLKEQKYEMVYARLARRLRQLNMTKFTEYTALLTGPKGADELGSLVDAITTNLTRFFREDYQLTDLANHLKALIADKKQKTLRIWSAGCSSGQEPYSLAIVVLEALAKERAVDVKILASDIDRNMLAKARRGLYSDNEASSMPKHFLKKYFDRQADGSWQAGRALKSLVQFNSLNLMEDWPFTRPFDVIFCRNVVIYFDDKTKQVLARRFCDALAPGGLMFLGHSEGLMGSTDYFVPVGRASFRKREGA